MRSFFITLTFAVVCLFGSSLASPIYDKRALGNIVQETAQMAGTLVGAVAESAAEAAEAAGEAVGDVGEVAVSVLRRSVPGDDDGGHLNKRRRILKKILRGAHRFSGSRSPRPRM
ncbi:hypothetical protein RMATCC62417_03669 [Rhizopus microsporus]|nr:hypothetical protein RMATCC62417_03669 [Rhizopus microsporus]